jgi:SAM-dependent methyltransferase
MKDEYEKQARFFELGERYFWFSSQNAIVEAALRPRLARLAAATSGRALRILDLGCGPGNTLTRLTRWGTGFGMDYSRDALQFAQSKGVARVFTGDCTALPLSSGAVDCLVALDVLEHVEDDAAALAEVVRVLRPGGAFCFAVPAFMSLWRYHDEAYGHYRRYSRRGFVGLVRQAGLRIEACHFIKCAFFPPLWVLARLERRGVLARRDNFFVVPDWLNRLMAREIEWEIESGIAGIAPFGVSLLCVGAR